MRFQLALAALLAATAPVLADVIPRTDPVAGSVVAVKTGEEIALVENPDWRSLAAAQPVKAGDVLRTNAAGQLAILFADRTQIRLGRNTTLVVKDLRPGADATFDLQSGSIWARAARGGTGVAIETPAATAAIRGTDWSLSVGPDGRTSLIVLEGVVELANAQGSVRVSRGEGATAAIGQAPTKIFTVSPNDREQMLFYVALRNGFSILVPAPLKSEEMRAERDRIRAIPPAARRPEDLVLFAEIAALLEDRPTVRAAVAAARAAGLTARQGARVDLVEALLHAQEGRYREADAGFRRVAPLLDPERRTAALYGGYFARALADPTRVEPAPTVPGGGWPAAVAEAFTAGFLRDVPTALRILAEAERRYPDVAWLPAIAATFAQVIDDRKVMREGAARALAIDPGNSLALEVRANLKASYDGDPEGALADLKAALEFAPGSSTLWNQLALLHNQRDADLEAIAAARKSVELDPEDALGHANLALLLLDDYQNEAARREIEEALRLDPGFDIAYIALGRYWLQAGDTPKAIEALLKGTTANPAYSNGLLLLAVAYYQNGETALADQAVENADRLDPNDSIVSQVRVSFALDGYRAGEAIEQGREAVRRFRAQGGDYARLSAATDEVSFLADALRFAGLEAWARYYANVAFDPFSDTGYTDLANNGSVTPFLTSPLFGSFSADPTDGREDNSALVQGLLINPLGVATRRSRPQLVRAPFVETTLEGGLSTGDGWGWSVGGDVQMQLVKPLPAALAATLAFDLRDIDASSVDQRLEQASITIGTKPTRADSAVAFLSYTDAGTGSGSFPSEPPPFYDLQQRLGYAGMAWARDLGHRNVVTSGVFGSWSGTDVEQVVRVPLLGGDVDARTLVDHRDLTLTAAVNHAVGFGPLTLRYGVEGGRFSSLTDSEVSAFLPGDLDTPVIGPIRSSSGDVSGFGRIYADAMIRPAEGVLLEAALFGTYFGRDGEEDDIRRIEPRIGAGWEFFDGHWLRGAWTRQTSQPNFVTLSPVGTVGLTPNTLPLDAGGSVDTLALRWDAEWTDRLFTSLEWQRQWLRDAGLNDPATLDPIAIDDARVDRIAFTTNAWLGYGLGAFATVAWSDSENGITDDDIPFLPETSARFGITWTHPSRVMATVQGNWVGRRQTDSGAELGGFLTTDAFLSWEPFDRRARFDLGVYNLFDRDFAISDDVPGWGRTIVGKLAVRF